MKRYRFFQPIALAGILALSVGSALSADSAKKNVLFIASDDLRPQLGCYGHGEMITPHLDALAALAPSEGA